MPKNVKKSGNFGKKISREFNFADGQNGTFRGSLILRIEVLDKLRGNLISRMVVYTFCFL